MEEVPCEAGLGARARDDRPARLGVVPMSRSDMVWCVALSVGLAVALAIGFALVGYEHEPSVPPQTAVSTYVGPGDGR